MRILFWSELFWPYLGGAELFGAQLISYLQSRGHEFMVMTSKHASDLPDEDHYKGVPIHRFPFREALGGAGIKMFPRIASEVLKAKTRFNPDAVFINGISPSTFFHLVTNGVQPSPVIVRVNQEVLCGEKRGDATITGKVLSAADWVACVSTPLLAQVHRLVPEISRRSSVIRNGLEYPEVTPKPLPFETPMLLCLGRLVRQKGFDLALAAFASICDRFPKVRLVVAGEGPERASLQREIVALGLANRVEFTGWVAPGDIFNLINTATVMLMPSRLEGLPSVGLQAGIMARPIIATRIGGLPEVVVDRKTGLLVAPEDSAELSKAIVYLLEHPEVAVRMGEAGRQRVMNLFSWETCVIEYERLCQQLTRQKTSRASFGAVP
jgi:glycogen(starch) synthase